MNREDYVQKAVDLAKVLGEKNISKEVINECIDNNMITLKDLKTAVEHTDCSEENIKNGNLFDISNLTENEIDNVILPTFNKVFTVVENLNTVEDEKAIQANINIHSTHIEAIDKYFEQKHLMFNTPVCTHDFNTSINPNVLDGIDVSTPKGTFHFRFEKDNIDEIVQIIGVSSEANKSGYELIQDYVQMNPSEKSKTDTLFEHYKNGNINKGDIQSAIDNREKLVIKDIRIENAVKSMLNELKYLSDTPHCRADLVVADEVLNNGLTISTPQGVFYFSFNEDKSVDRVMGIANDTYRSGFELLSEYVNQHPKENLKDLYGKYEQGKFTREDIKASVDNNKSLGVSSIKKQDIDFSY